LLHRGLLVEKLRYAMELRDEFEKLIRKLMEYIKEHDMRYSALERVCSTDGLNVVSTPRGFVIHVLKGGRARYTILFKRSKTEVIDWEVEEVREVGDSRIGDALRELRVEGLDACLDRYIARKEDELTKLRAVLALLDLVS
jgi:hypothetical protein